MIRRFLIVMLTSLVWMVQTADAGVDHSKPYSATVESVLAAEEFGSDKSAEQGVACSAGCVCQIFHHAVFNNPELTVDPIAEGVVFAFANNALSAFQISPPLRPPLV